MKYTVDKTSWPDGEWKNEPDKAIWKDAETNLDCMIVRGPHGAWCGYVGVTKDHPAYGKPYSIWDYDGQDETIDAIQKQINDIEVHYGLTYANECQGHICHPSDNGDHVYWFGFDCAHSGDYCPSHRHELSDYETYKNMDFAKREVAKLASQISKIN